MDCQLSGIKGIQDSLAGKQRGTHKANRALWTHRISKLGAPNGVANSTGKFGPSIGGHLLNSWTWGTSKGPQRKNSGFGQELP